ncbi:MAG TPA: cytochrome c [Alphaproteobacteria bacterium]|jgi:hypothetical protein|nr:cytochrome c [Alphaproteobacteria bacterium]
MRFNNLLYCGIALGLALSPAAVAKGKHKAAQPMTGETARIELPPGDDVLPDRRYAEAADRNCLSCHSTETILNQPALSRDVWKAEIDKMRTVFGAQIDPDADDGILAYLTTINGVRRDTWR